MNKIEQIKEKINGNPTLYDYRSYNKEWTQEEINQLLMMEYTEEVPELASQLNRSEYAIITKYIEEAENFESKLIFDVKVIPKDETGEEWEIDDYPLDDFNKNVSVVRCTLNDMVRVNIRLNDEKLRNDPPNGLDNILSHFISVPENGGAGGLFGGVRTTSIDGAEFDPDRYGVLKFKPNVKGNVQIGYQIKEDENDEVGVKKSILIIIE